MKKKSVLILFVILSILTISMYAQENSALKFDEISFDFGKIKQGIPVKHIFKFKNTGKQPAVIKNVTTSCGCTVPEYSQKPVLPDQLGKVVITYDAKSPLPFNKTIIVSLSTEKDPILIRIKGEVVNKIE
ncbi:DUF1573 domain-containing protein [Pedobacter sp. N36a]|uniref:DUF1573 domain-containing protein n=1 Tax=Pedobacter sp. N36a TaxID=2767996 RepID=UPI001656FE3A|nr:DUF1573 domain-containing protein [Pedobacter sp. N36a]MBC8985359.1 DUF1573 domain-containing protein [Pedobacter sp. N36a]